MKEQQQTTERTTSTQHTTTKEKSSNTNKIKLHNWQDSFKPLLVVSISTYNTISTVYLFSLWQVLFSISFQGCVGQAGFG